MHIELNLKIEINEEASPEMVEKFRLELRRGMLRYIFGASDAVGLDHSSLFVDGDIKTVDEPYVDPEPQVSYAHQDNPSGARFKQYAKDPVPPWAVDVQPLKG
jgi:hypothetical protein